MGIPLFAWGNCTRIYPETMLTDTKIKQAKPATKPYKLFDERGLFLIVTPNGGKWWRLKFRLAGREKGLSLGTYPEVSLAAARDRRDDARKQIAGGIDPGAERKAAKLVQTDSFEQVAREWYEKFSKDWAESHKTTVIGRLEQNIFPWLGARPVGEITPLELLTVLRRIESRGAIETAHRVKQVCGQVFCYAVATGRATHEISADLRGALAPVAERHHAAITDPREVAALLRAINGYQGGPVVRAALRFSALTFQRPGDIRRAEWAQIDLDNAKGLHEARGGSDFYAKEWFGADHQADQYGAPRRRHH